MMHLVYAYIITAYVTSSLISRSRDETMACFHACLNELPSQLRGFALKSTDLIYIHCVSNESFTVTVKGFTFVSLVCREVHISYVKNICKRRRSLISAVVANMPADELFAG